MIRYFCMLFGMLCSVNYLKKALCVSFEMKVFNLPVCTKTRRVRIRMNTVQLFFLFSWVFRPFKIISHFTHFGSIQLRMWGETEVIRNKRM